MRLKPSSCWSHVVPRRCVTGLHACELSLTHPDSGQPVSWQSADPF
jgi:hypothetical protein